MLNLKLQSTLTQTHIFCYFQIVITDISSKKIYINIYTSNQSRLQKVISRVWSVLKNVSLCALVTYFSFFCCFFFASMEEAQHTAEPVAADAIDVIVLIDLIVCKSFLLIYRPV